MAAPQKNVLLTVIAVVALLGAGFMFFRGGGRASDAPDRIQLHGLCMSCKTESTTTVRFGTREPLPCPSCKADALYQWQFCPDCQKRFIPQLERQVAGEPMRVVIPIRCPVCGGSNVTVFMPGMYDASDIKGDHPLPKWEP